MDTGLRFSNGITLSPDQSLLLVPASFKSEALFGFHVPGLGAILTIAIILTTGALAAADVADVVAWCVSRPPHVNVNTIEVMPVQQAFGPFAVDRKK